MNATLLSNSKYRQSVSKFVDIPVWPKMARLRKSQTPSRERRNSDCMISPSMHHHLIQLGWFGVGVAVNEAIGVGAGHGCRGGDEGSRL